MDVYFYTNIAFVFYDAVWWPAKSKSVSQTENAECESPDDKAD